MADIARTLIRPNAPAGDPHANHVSAYFFALAKHATDGVYPFASPANVPWGIFHPTLDKMRGVTPRSATAQAAASEYKSTRYPNSLGGVTFVRKSYTSTDTTTWEERLYVVDTREQFGLGDNDAADLYVHISVDVACGLVVVGAGTVGGILDGDTTNAPPQWHQGFHCEVHINQPVRGFGGGGGSHSGAPLTYPYNYTFGVSGGGGTGGIILYSPSAPWTKVCELYNNSTIASGGGGGGTGGSVNLYNNPYVNAPYGTTWFAGGGGGGNGASFHSIVTHPGNASYMAATAGGQLSAGWPMYGGYNIATYLSPGNGGSASLQNNAGGSAGGAATSASGPMANYGPIQATVNSGAGGAGGGFGSNGAAGGDSSYTWTGQWAGSQGTLPSSGSGGAAGPAIIGVDKIDIITAGTILGPQSNL